MMTKQHPSKRRIRVKSFSKNIFPHFALSREVPTAAVLLEMRQRNHHQPPLPFHPFFNPFNPYCQFARVCLKVWRRIAKVSHSTTITPHVCMCGDLYCLSNKCALAPSPPPPLESLSTTSAAVAEAMHIQEQNNLTASVEYMKRKV